MTILTFLKEDHQKVQSLVKKLEEKQDLLEKEQLFKEITHALKLHEEIEETYFYPAIKEPLKDLVLEAFEEHHVINNLLDELEGLSLKEDTWQAKFTVLKENLEHHISEEEETLFPKVKSQLSVEKLEKIGQKVVNYLK